MLFRSERARLHVVDAAAEAARGHVLLAGAGPDEALALARGDDGVVAVGGEGLVGDGHEHDALGVGVALPPLALRVAEREQAVLWEREVAHARPAALTPAARLVGIPVLVALHDEVARVPALRVALEERQRLGRVHGRLYLILIPSSVYVFQFQVYYSCVDDDEQRTDSVYIYCSTVPVLYGNRCSKKIFSDLFL